MELSDFHIKVLNATICPYCKADTKTISQTDVYGKEYSGRAIIACKNFPNCDAYVGTHEDGKALGRLANKTLRNAKINAHHWFDKIWKGKYIDRGVLYSELSDYLEIPREFTHIGMFSVKTCKSVEEWALNKYKNIING